MTKRFTKISSGLILGIMMTLFSSGITKAEDGDNFTYEGINYTVISEADKTCRTKAGDWSKSGNSGLTGELNIPTTVINPTTEMEYTVTEIGSYSFYYCPGLTGDLIIPESVEYIGKWAFKSCSGFTGDLIIGNSVKSIGENAFEYCSGFTGDLIIGNSVKSIGSRAFFDCSGFTGGLKIPDSVESIEDYAFYGCSGLTGNLIIGNSVQSIGDDAFYGCSGFTGNLIIGNSVQSIGYRAFYGCSGFTGDLIIGNSVQSIGNRAFYGCSGFTGDLIIGNSVQSIGYNAFYYCSGFTGDLKIPDSVQSIGMSAFEGCSGFTGNLIIGNSVKSISSAAFYKCNFSGDLIIGDSMEELTFVDYFFPKKGFKGKLVIGKSIKNIPNRVFELCNFTGELKIPDSVESIGIEAFIGCSGFTGDLIIGNSVQSIRDSAFEGCYGFTGDLRIPDSVQSIEAMAFKGCYGFTGQLKIPESVISIEISAFRDCSGFMGELKIPESVTSIGSSVFSGCSGFTGTLTIPESVTSIGRSAFNGCNNIDRILSNIKNNIPDQATDMFPTAFNIITKGKKIYVPDEKYDEYIEKWSNWNIAKMSELMPKGNLAIDNFSINAYETKEIPVNIEIEGDEAFSYKGFSFNINVPEGLTVKEVKLNEGLEGFSCYTSSQGNVTTVLCSVLPPADNISTILDSFITLVVEADTDIENNATGKITISKITFTSETNNAISFDDCECNVTYINKPVSGFTFTDEEGNPINDKDGVELYVDDSYSVTIGVEPADASIKDFTFSIIQNGNYVSSVFDENQKTITITGKDFGEATLTVTSEIYNVTASLSVNVVQKEIESVVISRKDNKEIPDGTLLLTPNDKVELLATLTPSERYTGASVEWTSDNTAVVTVDKTTGEITAISGGNAKVTATASNDKGSKTASIEVYVEILAQSISVTNEEPEDCFGNHSVKAGESVQLTAVVTPENATYKNVTWSVSDPTVAEIDQDGLLTFKTAGSVTVTATNSESFKPVSAQTTVEAVSPLLGDANDDGNVNVADVGAIGSYIISTDKEDAAKKIYSFCFTNADAVADKTIDEKDLNETIEIAMAILNGTYGTRSAANLQMPEGAETLIAECVDSENGLTSFGFRLENASAFRILHAEIELPERMENVMVTPGASLDGHAVMSNLTEGNILKIVIFSLNNSSFLDNGESLFSVTGTVADKADNLTANYTGAIGNDGIQYMLGFEGRLSESGVGQSVSEKATVTGGTGKIIIRHAEGQTVEVYSIDGKLLRSCIPASNEETINVTKGIYAVRAGDLTCKVVVK